MKILVTGGTSFIGSALVDRLWYSHHVTTLQRSIPKTHPTSIVGGRAENTFIQHDLRAPISSRILGQIGDTEVLIHAAAEVSGAASLKAPVPTVESNVLGTFHILEAARQLKRLKRFVYFSTGEVVGQVDAPGEADEDAPLHPSNPYSASKAAGEELCRAYHKCFGVPVVIVRPMNVFGPGQRSLRFVTTTIKRMLSGNPEIPTHVGVDGKPGSRNWIDVDGATLWIERIATATENSHYLPNVRKTGETFHIVGPELDNFQVVHAIGRGVGVTPKIQPVIAPPSHDLRYCLKDTKLGINHFESVSKRATVNQIEKAARWYKENPSWLGC